MKTAAAAAMVLGLVTPADVVAEPKILSDFELDAITAAGVLVDVSSFAVAFGDVALSHTSTDTVALSGDTYELAFGLTVGEAFACCGEEADVAVGSTVFGIGDIVHGATHGADYDGLFSAYGFSMGFILALSFEEHLGMVQERRLVMFDGLRAALVEVGNDFRAAVADAFLPHVE